jgi:hypothetical membrane protein
MQRLGAICGIAGPGGFLVLYGVAISGDTSYVFFEDWLSDLGIGEAAWAFNMAVIVAGVLTFPFFLLGIRPAIGSGIVAQLAVAMALVSAVLLILVGIYTEDYVLEHGIVSVGFFMSTLVALGLLSFVLHREDPLGKEATLLTEMTFTVEVILTLMGFNPQTETVSVLSIVTWLIVLASILLWRSTHPPTPLNIIPAIPNQEPEIEEVGR